MADPSLRSNAISPYRAVSFSGGGHNSHSLLAGLFAGALDRLERLGSRNGMVDLMGRVNGLSALSGGSWFLAGLAYSQKFNNQFDSISDRDNYTTTGYIGALKQVVDRVNGVNISIPSELLTNINNWRAGIISLLNELLPEESQRLMDQTGRNLDALTAEVQAGVDSFLKQLEFFFKMLKTVGADSNLDWRRVVDTLVYEPLGMKSELAGKTLSGSRLAWAADKDLVIAAALTTRDAVLDTQQIGSTPTFNRIFAHASPDPLIRLAGVEIGRSHLRPLSLRSLVRPGASPRGSADAPGGAISIHYSNDSIHLPPALGPDPLAARTVAVGSSFSADALSVIDATVASSSALALAAQPEAFREVALVARMISLFTRNRVDDLLTLLLPLEKNLAQTFRDLAPRASLKDNTFQLPATPTFSDISQRYSQAIENRELRIADGGYVENSSATSMLRHIQQNVSASDPFELTLFINSDGAANAAGSIQMQTASGGLTSYKVVEDLAKLFGRTGAFFDLLQENSAPGSLADGPFPVLSNRAASAQLFSPNAWFSETGPEWQFASGDLSIKYYDLNVTTVDNPQLGVVGGQRGRLRVFASNNVSSFALPIASVADITQNYEQTRRAIATQGGDRQLFASLGLLPMLSFGGQRLQIIGNDLASDLRGESSNDTLYGGDGNDSLDGGAGIDQMEGGRGDDIYVIDRAGDLVVEERSAGTDLVRSSVSYQLGVHVENLELTGSSATSGTGNLLDNQLRGNSAANNLIGDAGNDTLDGGGNADTMTGGGGDDVFFVDHISDVVIERAGEGRDTTRSLLSHTLAAHVDRLVLIGADSISGTGNDLANEIIGNGNANVLTGMGGVDTLQGGAGNDTYVVQDKGDIVVEGTKDLDFGGIDLVQSTVDFELPIYVENLTLLPSAAREGIGNDATNLIIGNSNPNLLDGRAGNDTMQGGLGNDTYSVNSSGDVVVEAINSGIDRVRSSASYVLAANVEELELTGTSLINGMGNELANLILGNTAANRLDGLAGADTLIGGAGDDLYVVDNTGDVVTELAASGIDQVQSAISYTLTAEVEFLVLSGSGAIDGRGNVLANRITGNSANNRLFGEAGNDSLDGLAGADSMTGGAGDDLYVVDNTGDVVTELAAGGNDQVQSTISYTLAAEVEALVLSGSSAIDGRGNVLANRIIGNSGNNRLWGAAGNDSLDGGLGNDTLIGCDVQDQQVLPRLAGRAEIDVLIGGAGNDLFRLGSSTPLPGTNPPVNVISRFYDDGNTANQGLSDYALITDFTPGQDRLELIGSAASYFLAPSGLSNVTGIGLWLEQGATDELIAILRSGNPVITLTAANTISSALFI